ncbi:TetR/AcrR family transcriptional regulator [Rhodococcoides yunnanense]|uniref:TetR/AcrR family transcriptional regulator n=1 Tax=Rhodococcoides yunnanense TaxID=278209 RepID=UPI000935232F|nr:TetR family transcriptional regulator [Rhodococcus yunnanensis]
MVAPTRSGRRPGRSGTKESILSVARTLFADKGFDKTSVRAIAAEVGVDAALVHHYFGTKRQLFVAAIALPVDPTKILDTISAARKEDLGRSLVSSVLRVWESDNGEALVAAFRSMIATGDTSLLSTFLMQVVLRDIAARVDEPAGSAPERVNLVASQMSGLLLTRHVLKLEPIASMPADRVVESIAPTLQRYLTGPLPGY